MQQQTQQLQPELELLVEKRQLEQETEQRPEKLRNWHQQQLEQKQ